MERETRVGRKCIQFNVILMSEVGYNVFEWEHEHYEVKGKMQQKDDAPYVMKL
jgi:hypothetical protein